jgi:undecaprenyl-diphosphatase
MSYFDAILLGLLQGLTEFLPVSSSGHLVLTEHLLGAKNPGVTFELLVHLGTLLAVLIYFRKRIIAMIRSIFDTSMFEERKLVLYIIIATIPAVIVALTLEDTIEAAFGSPLLTSIMLLVTGVMLLLTGLAPKKEKRLSWFNSLFIGLGQAVAIFPGISRSGSTISFGLFAGVKATTAAEFSFLLSIPAIAGAAVFKIKELFSLDVALAGQYLTGTILSFLSGLLAVYLLLSIVRKGKFQYFGIYCLLVGTVGLVYFL